MRTSKWKRLLHLVAWVLIIGAAGAAVMLLWNWLMPALFGLTAIGYWQSLGLLVLTRILFGRFGGRGGMMHGGGMHGRHHGMMGGMHGGGMHGMGGGNPIHEKWMKMTPEEREAFIKERRKHFAPFGKRDFFGDRLGGCDREFMHAGEPKNEKE